MDYQEFKEQFKEAFSQGLYEAGIEARTEERHVDKLNSSYDAVTVTPEGMNIGVNMNINLVYDRMEAGQSFEEAVRNAVVAAVEAIGNMPVVNAAEIMDYEQMKEKLTMDVVSAETNADLLKDVPHKNMEDIAVVYRFELSSDENSRSSVLVTNRMIESMGVSAEQLHNDAMRNAPEMKPVVIKGMNEVMAEMMGVDESELGNMGVPIEEGREAMYVATVPNKTNGAGIIAYENFMEQASERIGGGDFFILPSSIHEILIVPDDGRVDLKTLQSMVREVNATSVSPEEKLTDSVYHYDSKNKVFELGETFTARKELEEMSAEEKPSVRDTLMNKKDEIAKTRPNKGHEKGAPSKKRGGDAL